MSTRPRFEREARARARWTRAAGPLLIAAVGCAAVPEQQPPRVASVGSASTDAASPAPLAVVPAAPVAPPRVAPGVPGLERFHEALRGLVDKTRREHVRVLWIGDSHGQADFWSGQLRRSLAEKFGGAGPGFVHLGYKNYRHDGLKLDIQGKWRMRPKRPVWFERQDDGVFGLGGLMMSGYADVPRVVLTHTERAPGARYRYDLCYRFHKPDDSLVIDVEGSERRELRVTDATPTKVVHHVELAGPASSAFVVMPRGRTDLCGVVVESEADQAAGVVVDTLAINGARFGTALAWDEDAWVAEVARRSPALVIFELGTNEAGDGTPKYAKVALELEALLGRARKAAPTVDCLVVSPTDRADAEDRAEAMREALAKKADALGCAWFDAWEILGGKGAMAKLREEPDGKVQPDGIHLTIKGYRALGVAMFEQLTKGL